MASSIQKGNFRTVGLLLICIFLMHADAALNKTADQWNDEGVNLYQNMSYTESLSAFENAIALQPDHEYAWFNKGLSLAASGDYNNSLKAFEKTIAINPLSADNWYEKGRILELLGNIAESEDAYATYDKLSQLEENQVSSIESVNPEKTTETIKGTEIDSESLVMDEKFDQLYQENDPKISENLHQITIWIQDKNWGEIDKNAGKMTNFITDYVAEMKSLKLSPEYDGVRDSYVFFLKQLANANRELSTLASLYPLYYNNVMYYSKENDTDFMNRLNTVINTLGTARTELKRFNEMYSSIHQN